MNGGTVGAAHPGKHVAPLWSWDEPTHQFVRRCILADCGAVVESVTEESVRLAHALPELLRQAIVRRDEVIQAELAARTAEVVRREMLGFPGYGG